MTGCFFNTVVLVAVVKFHLEIEGVLGAPEPSASWWDRHKESISCVRPGYFVNPADCHSFYRCVDRSTWNKPALQRYDFTCPSGMVFDVAFSVCTKPGANGCADPWWPGSGESPGNRRPEGSSGSGSKGGDNSLERLPSIFSERPGGTNKPSENDFGGDPLDIDFDSPSTGSSKPGTGGGLFSGGDPLDTDFGTPSRGGAARPSAPRGGGLFGGGKGTDPLDADFGSNGSSTRPGTSGGGLFSGESGGDPLDADFGSPSNGDSTKPSVDLFNRESNGPFGGKGGSASDPLDADFGSSPGNSGSRPAENSNDIPPFLRDRLSPGSRTGPGSSGSPFGNSASGVGGDPLDTDLGSTSGNSGSREDSSSGSNEDRSKNSGNRKGSSNSGRNPGSGDSENWWGTSTNSPPNWSSNDNSANSIEFDIWDSSAPSQNSNKPSTGGNWGGASRPGGTTNTGETPWRPSFPWGSDSSNDLGSGSSSPSIPQSPTTRPPSSSFPSVPQSPSRPPSSSTPSFPPPPPPNRSSWWDPPYALPYRPRGPEPFPANPGPPLDPWAYSYRPRPRYPSYQIVAYPTWQGPYNRNPPPPLIVVYSNSKK